MEYTCPEALSSHMHKHALTLVDFTGYRTGRVCDVCSQPAKNELVYQCKPCGFDVHPLCTLIPRKLKHALHPNHQLNLEPSTTKSCAICRGVCTSWQYSCKSCSFYIHPECALENFSHSNTNIRVAARVTPHLVQAKVPRGYASVTSAPQDNPMRHQIIGPASVAATLTPQQVQAEVPRGYVSVTSAPQDNPKGNRSTCPMSASLSSHMHKHILTLVDFTGYRSGRVCDVCSQRTNELVYQCKACNFDVHPLCTLIPRKLKHALHPNHQLVLEPSTTKSCAVCRSACTRWRYSCKSCGFYIHPECALENLSHSKTSVVTSNTQRERVEFPKGYASVTSALRDNTMNHNTTCPTSDATTLTPQQVQVEVPRGYASVMRATQDNPIGNQITCPTSIEGMVTPQLVQVEVPRVYASVMNATQDNPMRNQITCPTSVAVTLTPQQVQAEVPQGYAIVTKTSQNNPIGHQITFPTCATLSSYMHKHKLTLIDYTRYHNNRVCDVCTQKVNELVYQCKPCGFDVHPLCTLFPKQLRHALHPNHQLILQSSTTKSCAVCRGACTSWRYSCKSCDFHIHPECVLQTSSHLNSNTNNRAAATPTPQPVPVEVPRGYITGVASVPQDYFNNMIPNTQYGYANNYMPHYNYNYSQHNNYGNYPIQGMGAAADNSSNNGKGVYEIVQDLAAGVISDVIFGALNMNFS